MKKRLGFLMMGLILLGMIGIVVLEKNQKNEAKLVTINTQDFLDVIESKKSGVFYIGRPTCVHCQDFQPKLEEALEATNKQIFYYNTDEAKKEDNIVFEKIVKVTNISSVPMLIVIKNGVVITKLSDYKDQEKIETFLRNEVTL